MYTLKAEDLSVKKSSWDNWPSHLVLPMMLMRENMKQSMLQSINRSSLDLSNSPRPRNRLSQESPGGGFVCGDCGRTYKLKSSLRNHQKWECGKEPQFNCPFCVYKAKQKMHMARHMERMHREIDYSSVKTEIKTEVQDNENKQIDINNDNIVNNSSNS